MTDRDDLIHTAGQAHCSYDECDWGVPVGMEYLYSTHRREDHDDASHRDIPCLLEPTNRTRRTDSVLDRRYE